MQEKDKKSEHEFSDKIKANKKRFEWHRSWGPEYLSCSVASAYLR